MKIHHPISEVVSRDDPFRDFARAIRTLLEAGSADGLPDDEKTAKRRYVCLFRLNMLEGRFQEVISGIRPADPEVSRDIECRVMESLALAIAEAMEESNAGPEKAAMRQAFARRWAERLDGVSWDEWEANIKFEREKRLYYSEKILMGTVKAQLDPQVTPNGEVSFAMACSIVKARYWLKCLLPLREEIIRVCTEALARNKSVKPNIWPARAIELNADRKLAPVIVALWDSGVDPAVLGDRMFVNAREPLDGEDNDGNGFIDDRHGIAFDCDANPTPDMLYPLGEAAPRRDEIIHYMECWLAAQSADDSPEEHAHWERVSQLEPDQVQAALGDISLVRAYMHGTHAAGIVAEGNPFVRILSARTMMGYHLVPRAMTAETARHHARSYRETSRYCRARGVRVVSVSWGWPYSDIVGGLSLAGEEASVEAREKRARVVYDILKEGMHDAIADYPEMLFIAAAGAGDERYEAATSIPSCLELPNLVIVGSADRTGKPFSPLFTSRNGVWANGFEVKSPIPGGKRLRWSGPSSASASVANLAAKLIALKPDLAPEAVIRLIREGADRVEGEVPVLLVNPKKSLERLEHGS